MKKLIDNLKYALAVIFFVSISYNLSSQNITVLRSTLGSSGSGVMIEGSSKNYYVQQSMGQLSPIGSCSLKQISLNQGFIQPIGSALINEPKTLAVSFYPNPVITDISIFIQEKIEDDIYVTVTDVAGKEIFNQTFTDMQTITVNLANVKSGNYILNIKSNNKNFSSNLIKL